MGRRKKGRIRPSVTDLVATTPENLHKIMEEWSQNGYNMQKAVMTIIPDIKYSNANRIAHSIYKYNNVQIDEELKRRDMMLESQIKSVAQRRLWLSDAMDNETLSFADRLSAEKQLDKIEGVGNPANNNIYVQSLSIEDKKKAFLEKAEKMMKENHEVIDAEVKEVE